MVVEVDIAVVVICLAISGKTQAPADMAIRVSFLTTASSKDMVEEDMMAVEEGILVIGEDIVAIEEGMVAIEEDMVAIEEDMAAIGEGMAAIEENMVAVGEAETMRATSGKKAVRVDSETVAVLYIADRN